MSADNLSSRLREMYRLKVPEYLVANVGTVYKIHGTNERLQDLERAAAEIERLRAEIDRLKAEPDQQTGFVSIPPTMSGKCQYAAPDGWQVSTGWIDAVYNVPDPTLTHAQILEAVAAERERWRTLVAEMYELSDNWPGIAYSEDMEKRVKAALGLAA